MMHNKKSHVEEHEEICEIKREISDMNDVMSRLSISTIQRDVNLLKKVRSLLKTHHDDVSSELSETIISPKGIYSCATTNLCHNVDLRGGGGAGLRLGCSDVEERQAGRTVNPRGPEPALRRRSCSELHGLHRRPCSGAD